MKPLRKLINEYGSEFLIIFAGSLLVFLLMWYRIGSLTHGLAAPIEVASQQTAFSWQAILANPLYAPYTIVQRLVMLTGHDGITSMRLVSTVWALGAIALFYLVARQWHNVRVAVLATWLFISSSWFLHAARLATPDIMWLVAILGLVVLFSPRKEGKFNWLSFPFLIGLLCLIAYIPAMIWLVLLSVVLRRKNIAEAWKASPHWSLNVLTVLGGAALLLPLARAFYYNRSLLLQWAGSDGTLETPIVIARQFLSVPKQLFVSGPLDPVHWLGRLPLLSIFEVLMFIVGVWFYARNIRAARSRFIIVLSLLAWLLIAIGGVASLSLIVPVVYLVLTTGIAYMLHEWFQVFPHNPVARALGVTVIAAAILLTSIYQTRSYFVAWRYNPDTRQVFTERL